MAPLSQKLEPPKIPGRFIIFNSNGMQVAVVSDDKAEIRKVGVKRDMGTQVELDSGVKAGDRVILNPPVDLLDGSKVQPRLKATASNR